MAHMNKLALGIVAALVAVPSAEGATLRLSRLASTTRAPVASATGGLAYLASATELVVLQAPGSPRTYAVPTGCRPLAIGPGVVALACPSTAAPMVLLTPSGSVLTVPVASAAGYDGAIAIGRQWLLADTTSSTDGVHQIQSRALINWRTGRSISLGAPEPFGQHEYADLDSIAPGRRLCAPVIRAGVAAAPFEDVPFASVEKVGQWILQTAPTSVRLQRCGKGTVTTFATGLGPHEALTQDARAVLGSDAVGYLQGRRVVYRDLRSKRRWTAPWPTTQRPALGMFDRQLVVSVPSATGDYTIYKASRLSR